MSESLAGEMEDEESFGHERIFPLYADPRPFHLLTEEEQRERMESVRQEQEQIRENMDEVHWSSDRY